MTSVGRHGKAFAANASSACRWAFSYAGKPLSHPRRPLDLDVNLIPVQVDVEVQRLLVGRRDRGLLRLLAGGGPHLKWVTTESWLRHFHDVEYACVHKGRIVVFSDGEVFERHEGRIVVFSNPAVFERAPDGSWSSSEVEASIRGHGRSYRAVCESVLLG